MNQGRDVTLLEIKGDDHTVKSLDRPIKYTKYYSLILLGIGTGGGDSCVLSEGGMGVFAAVIVKL